MSRLSVNDEERYEALRREGVGKQKAWIANTPRRDAGVRGSKAPPYEEWTRNELYRKAREIGIEGRSEMNKAELISALRIGS